MARSSRAARSSRRGTPPAGRTACFLHVPAGVHVEAPLRAALELTAEGSALYHRVLVVVERGARVTFTEEFFSSVPGYLNVVVELKVADDAHLEYVTIQNHHAETRQFGTHRATVGRDASLDWIAAAMGGTRAKSRMESYLADRGASVKVTGRLLPDRARDVDYDTTQEHAAPTRPPTSRSRASSTSAVGRWRGVIRVDRGAQKTDAYQENRNLLLSPDAQATPIPGLEIEANDVRCTHGATVGQVDAQHLFYLMSRGLAKADAQRASSAGFSSRCSSGSPRAGARPPRGLARRANRVTLQLVHGSGGYLPVLAVRASRRGGARGVVRPHADP